MDLELVTKRTIRPLISFPQSQRFLLLILIKNLTIGIIHCGAPSGGMNAATKTVVRYALNLGYTVLGIHNGFSGLVQGEVSKLNWMDVESWTVEGGSNLGTNRTEPSDNLGFVAFQLQKYEIKALVVIGGFEGFNSIKQMREARKTYPSFCIPLCLIPATVSNNVPGTFYTLGSDTALKYYLKLKIVLFLKLVTELDSLLFHPENEFL
jgi:6-phosphofructokinase 1